MCRKRVPDSWNGDVETLSTELSLGLCNKHVVSLIRMEVRSTTDVDDWHTNVAEPGLASAVDRINSSDCFVMGQCHALQSVVETSCHLTLLEDKSRQWETLFGHKSVINGSLVPFLLKGTTVATCSLIIIIKATES